MAMGDPSTRIDDLLQSVADGEAIDWQALEREAREDVAIRRLLDELRLIADVASVHRSPEFAGAGGNAPPRSTPAPAHESSPADASPAADGGSWGHLRLIDRIGEGAFGEVFHARDTWLDHAVALKLLKPHLRNQSQLLQEARTLAKIRHENVVRVHGADVHDGRIGFWMEFVPGHTLEDVVTGEGVRSAHEAAVIGQALCRAIAAVHAKDIAHRDIKAKNVMREVGGRVVLMDFGAGEPLTGAAPGQRMGTPLYLAPELFEGAAASPQSDIYALGVLLFYLVSGGYPVTGTSLDELKRAHRAGRRTRLGDLRPDLPDAFVRVVETMVRPEPSARYPTAAEAREALERVVTPAEPREAPGSRPVRIAASVALAAVCVTLFGFLSSASFNLTFGRRAGFEIETLGTWFGTGVQALVSPVIRIGMALVLLTMLVAAVRIVCRVVAPIGDTCRRWQASVVRFRREHALDDPTLMLQLVTGLGACAFLALGLLFWEQTSAFAIYIDSAPREQLAVLQPANEPRFDVYGRLLELALLFYGLAAYAVMRSARRSGAGDAGIARGVMAAAVAVPVLALVLLRALPYRTVYQSDFVRVDLGDVRCYAIGTRPGDVLLHCPDAEPPRNVVVAEDDRRLRRRGFVENVFTPRSEARAAGSSSR